MTTDIKLYNLEWQEIKTYINALLFVAGNILLPQLCHLFGIGHILLPIYFFTLVAAYKYGLNVGLLTAIFSPLASHFLFGMPQANMVMVIMIKSVLLAVIASYIAKKCEKVSILALLTAVVAYQLIGTAIEGLFFAETLGVAASRLMDCFPGILLQIFGGYLVLNILKR